MKLYYCKIAEFSDMSGKELLPKERRHRMERYLRPQDKIRCLIAGLMLRTVLGDEHTRIYNNSYGKPMLDSICFNLSHSGEYVILGVSDCEIGVDIEEVREFDECVAKSCFTKAELEWLYNMGTDEAFYRLWTAKESVMKAIGLGMSMEPECFSVLPVQNGEHEINNKRWYMNRLELDGHSICVACAEDKDIELIQLSREQLLK